MVHYSDAGSSFTSLKRGANETLAVENETPQETRFLRRFCGARLHLALRSGGVLTIEFCAQPTEIGIKGDKPGHPLKEGHAARVM